MWCKKFIIEIKCIDEMKCRLYTNNSIKCTIGSKVQKVHTNDKNYATGDITDSEMCLLYNGQFQS